MLTPKTLLHLTASLFLSQQTRIAIFICLLILSLFTGMTVLAEDGGGGPQICHGCP